MIKATMRNTCERARQNLHGHHGERFGLAFERVIDDLQEITSLEIAIELAKEHTRTDIGF